MKRTAMAIEAIKYFEFVLFMELLFFIARLYENTMEIIIAYIGTNNSTSIPVLSMLM